MRINIPECTILKLTVKIMPEQGFPEKNPNKFTARNPVLSLP